MLGTTWNNEAITKQLISFGSLFTDIYINRTNSEGQPTQTIQVPVDYGPKESFLFRINADPDLKRPAMVLPRITYQMQTMTYDPSRKMNSLGKKRKIDSDAAKLMSLYNPVPYNFGIDMSIIAKTISDANQIVEQVCAMFTPEWTVNINLIPSMNVIHDIPIALLSTRCLDTYETNFQTRRAIIWDLSFNMQGYIYGPVSKQGVIKETIVHTYHMANNGLLQTFDTTPGLTANGEPTSNASLSVDISLINANSNYGYITTITET